METRGASWTGPSTHCGPKLGMETAQAPFKIEDKILVFGDNTHTHTHKYTKALVPMSRGEPFG